MSKRTPGQVYGDLINAGFSPAQAATMTAISGAESGYDPGSLGDTNLETDTWGPSYGLFQIRTLKSQTGTGGVRDINALAGDEAAQAKAAWEISGHGTNFSPWSVYNTGKYQAFLPAAQKIAAADDGGPFPTVGPGWLPWNWASDAGNTAAGVAGQAVTGVRNLGLQAVFVVGGVALLGVGVVVMLRPQISRAGAWLGDKKRDAAQLATVIA